MKETDKLHQSRLYRSWSRFWRHRTNRLLLAFVVVTLLFFAFLIAVPPTTSRGVLLRIVLVCPVWPAALYFAFLLVNRIFPTGNSSRVQLPLAGTYTLELARLFSMPVVICDHTGRIVWFNPAMETFLDTAEHPGKFMNENIAGSCGVSVTTLLQNAEDGYELTLDNTRFRVYSYQYLNKQRTYVFTLWENRDELYTEKEKAADETPMIGFLVVDNPDELVHDAPEQSNIASAHIQEVLQKWAEENGIVLREYDRDHYMLLLSYRDLKKITARNFDVFEKVREIRVGDGSVPVTLSIGFSDITGNLTEKEKEARRSLKLALQRGGAQVVLKENEKITFLGGFSKAAQTDITVDARNMAKRFASRIVSAGNVIIMGHRNADFDAFGSAVGLARICMFCGVRVNILLDPGNTALPPCLRIISRLKEYEHIFVTEQQALDLVDSDTLLILTDVNNPRLYDSPVLYESAHTVAFIDHHHRTEPADEKAVIDYIEPSATSASELVTELIRYTMSEFSLKREEASLLYAGILLDTRQLSRNVTQRTFGACQYLNTRGSVATDAQSLFLTDMEGYMRQARFTDVGMYRGSFAIAANHETDNVPSDHIVGAKVADKLLSVAGVDASFAVCRIGEDVHISARCANQKVNIAKLMAGESLCGGGFFESGAAVLQNTDVAEGIRRLYRAIDDYLEQASESGTEIK